MIKALLIDLDGVIRLWPATQDADAEIAVGLPDGAIKRVAFAADLLLPAITEQQSEIFQAALQALAVPATATMFVDDTLKNVTAAATLGMYGHHYQRCEALTEQLEADGLL